MDLAEYGITIQTLQSMLEEWQRGVPKSTIERRYLGKSTHHGKLFTRLVREFLHVNTEHVHPLRLEVDRLRGLLVAHGIDPDSESSGSTTEQPILGEVL
jgi:adenylosuccinate lyase